MKKQTIITLTALLAFVALGTSGAAAIAMFTPAGGEWAYEWADEGTQWIDEDGIFHVRDGVLVWTVVGGDFEIIGETYSIISINLDLATGNGDGKSFNHLEVSYGDLVGVFEGHDNGPYTGFVRAGEFNYHGSGDFAGMKFRGDSVIVQGSGVMFFAGIMHDPQGDKNSLGDKSASEASSWGTVKALYR